MFDLIGILAVLGLVVANGFFVAAEFSLVAVRRSRVAELVSARRTNATALQRAVENLDAYLAATQLGITISSLAVGWIGEGAPSGSIASRRRCAPKRLNAAWLVVSPLGHRIPPRWVGTSGPNRGGANPNFGGSWGNPGPPPL
jgi:CBS domain containing-hemolysin-like protein